MGQVKELVIALQAEAHNMGDDYGQSAETVDLLAKMFNVPREFVQDALKA